MKRIIIVLMILLALTVIMAACGGKTAPPAAEEPAQVEQAQQEEAAPTEESAPAEEVASSVDAIHQVAEPTTIRFTTWRQEDVEMWDRIIAEFDKLDTNVTVEYAPVLNTEYDSVLKTNLQSGTADEIIFVRSWDAGRTLFDAGHLEAITPEMVPNINDFAGAQLASWQTEDGAIYGVPGNWVGYGILYNQKIFDELGITPPETIDDFFGVCVTLNGNGIIPVAGGSKDPWTLEHMVSDHFLPVYYDGEVGHQKFLAGEILPSSPEFIDHLNFMVRLRDECWTDGYEGIGYSDSQQMFVSEMAGMFLAGSWEIAVFEDLNPELQMAYASTPVLNEGDKQWLSITPAGAYGLNAGISPEQREAALVFLNWLASPEGGQIQGNELVGQFPSMPNTPPPDHPIAGEWVAAQGDGGENLTIWWSFQTINAQEPGSQPLSWEALQGMMNGEMTPEEAAMHIQDGVASWYEPWQGGAEASASAEETTASADPIHQVTEPTTIRFTTWRQEDVEMWDRIIAEFDKLDTNVTVEYAPVLNTEYDSVLKTNLQSGTADEIIFVRSWDAGRTLYDAGHLEAITPEMVPNINDFAGAQLASWQTEDGAIYGVPGNWVGYGILYNQKMFDELGITAPETIDDFFGICATLTENGIIPVAGGSKDPWTLEHMVSDHFLPVYYDGEIGHQKFLAGEILPSSPEFIEHLNFMLRLRDECWTDGYEGIGYGDSQQMFVAELAGMFLAGSWEIAVFEGLNPDLQMAYAPTPVLNKGDKQWLSITPAGAYGLNANLTPEQREAALVFLNWLAGPEGGQIQGNELVGQFPSMPNTPPPDHPIAGEWVAAQGDGGENLTIWWSFQTINAQEPGSQPLSWEALQGMMNGEMTPEEAAMHIQDGVASWYEPWQQ